MPVLSDIDIKSIVDDFGAIDPFNHKLLQASSYDVTFDSSKIYIVKDTGDIYYSVSERKFFGLPEVLVSFRQNQTTELEADDVYRCVEGYDSLLLPRNRLALVSTIEKVTIPPGYCAIVCGKSTLARAGLMVHITAGFIDTGFIGNITLELFNVAPWDIEINNGDAIAQIVFYSTTNDHDLLYNNHYQNQSGVTLPK